jgi:hypothetical protein
MWGVRFREEGFTVQYHIPSTATRGLTALAEKRYWSPQAQAFAAGDHLLWYIYEGWSVSNKVEGETHWFSNNRYVVVYKFTLAKGRNRIVMPVVNNPFVQNLVLDLQTDTLPVWEHSPVEPRSASRARR